jgi:hypothetical protein
MVGQETYDLESRMKCEIKGCRKKAGMRIDEKNVCVTHGYEIFRPAVNQWMIK